MKRFTAVALLFLSTTAMGQEAPVETVTSHGRSLAGVWRVQRPTSIAAQGFFSPWKWGPLGETFCRVGSQGDDLVVSCANGFEAGTVAVDDDRLHFAWGTMMLRITLDGVLDDADHFRGRAAVKIAGIAYEHPAPSEAVRVTPDRAAPDAGGKAALLRQILEEGLAAMPRDEKAMKEWGPPPRLGAVTAITWVGQETRDGPPNRPSQPGYFSVYLVNFAEGQRLCSLHQRGDGLLEWFRCA